MTNKNQSEIRQIYLDGLPFDLITSHLTALENRASKTFTYMNRTSTPSPQGLVDSYHVETNLKKRRPSLPNSNAVMYITRRNSPEGKATYAIYRDYLRKKAKHIIIKPAFVTLCILGIGFVLSHQNEDKVYKDLKFHEPSYSAGTGRMVNNIEHDCIIGRRGVEDAEVAKNNIESYLEKEGFSEEKADKFVDKLETQGKLDYIEKGRGIR